MSHTPTSDSWPANPYLAMFTSELETYGRALIRELATSRKRSAAERRDLVEQTGQILEALLTRLSSGSTYSAETRLRSSSGTLAVSFVQDLESELKSLHFLVLQRALQYWHPEKNWLEKQQWWSTKEPDGDRHSTRQNIATRDLAGFRRILEILETERRERPPA